MVYLLFVWLKIALYGLTIGRLIFKDAEPVPKMWGGIAVIVVVTGFLNLFVPVDKDFQIVCDVFILALAFLQWKKLKSDIIEMFSFINIENNFSLLIFVSVTGVITLFANSARSTLTDMGFYYIQSIKWIQEFPAVPGLGNLFTRLANNSNWFVASALFNPKWLVPAYPLNGFLFFTAILYLLKLHYDVTFDTEPRIRSIFFALAIGTAITLYQWKVEAPNTDVAVTLLFWILCGLFIVAERDILRTHTLRVLIVVLALFIPTIKLNYLPALLIPAYLVWKEIKEQKWQLAVITCISALLIYIPWCIRSVILSGYLVFPIYQIDLFNFDWKMPKEILIYENELIKWWARVPYIDTTISSKMTLSEWLPNWILNLTLVNKALLLSTIVGTILYLKDIVFKISHDTKENLVLFITSLAGVIICLVAAPDLRFCYGFLMMLNAIAYKDFVLKIFGSEKVRTAILYLGIVCMVLTGIFIARTADTGILVPCHRYPGSLRIQEVNGIKIHMAQSPGEMGDIAADDSAWVRWWKQNHRGIYEDRLWDAGLPASPYIRPGLKLRGESIKDGFKIVNP